MLESVTKHYQPRPNNLRNSADNLPIDEETVDDYRRIERDLATVCTEQVVSVTIDTNE